MCKVVITILASVVVVLILSTSAVSQPWIGATMADTFPDPDNDQKAEPGETITYTVVITNTGNEAAEGVVFTDTIDPNTTLVPGTMNISPLANDDSYSTLEDTPLTVATPGVLSNDTDADGDELTAALVHGPTNGNLTTFNPDGSFTYTPDANFNGSDAFTYMANDGTDDSDIAEVRITIDPVNDVPSFTKGPDQEVLEDAGAQTVPGWATAISPGPTDLAIPGNEAGQTVQFNVTGNTNPALFAVAPAVDPISGDLTYTPAPDANGSADITIELQDDGGTANGGQDTSAPQSFTITVLALYSIDPKSNCLRVVDPNDASTTASVTITLADETVTGGTGLATNPLTGELWALLKINNTTECGPDARELVTIDPTTGVATSVGNTGDAFAGLAFDSNGQLFGVTGDGACQQERLFTLDPINATPQLCLVLGNGNDGEAIAFNPVDRLLYHASGFGNEELASSVPAELVFEKTIDPDVPCDGIMDIPLDPDSPLIAMEVNAITYSQVKGKFYWAQSISAKKFSPLRELYRVATDGTAELFIGTLDHRSKGLAFSESPVGNDNCANGS